MRDLGRISKIMGKTGIVYEGFCFSDWEKITLREQDIGYKLAKKIINLTQGYRCQFIAFEHLGNLNLNTVNIRGLLTKNTVIGLSRKYLTIFVIMLTMIIFLKKNSKIIQSKS